MKIFSSPAVAILLALIALAFVRPLGAQPLQVQALVGGSRAFLSIGVAYGQHYSVALGFVRQDGTTFGGRIGVVDVGQNALALHSWYDVRRHYAGELAVGLPLVRIEEHVPGLHQLQLDLMVSVRSQIEKRQIVRMHGTARDNELRTHTPEEVLERLDAHDYAVFSEAGTDYVALTRTDRGIDGGAGIGLTYLII